MFTHLANISIINIITIKSLRTLQIMGNYKLFTHSRYTCPGPILKVKINSEFTTSSCTQIDSLKSLLHILNLRAYHQVSVFYEIGLRFQFHYCLGLCVSVVNLMSRFANEIVFVFWFFHVVQDLFLVIFQKLFENFVYVDLRFLVQFQWNGGFQFQVS